MASLAGSPSAHSAICLAMSTSTPANPPDWSWNPYGGWAQRTPTRSTPPSLIAAGTGGSVCAAAVPSNNKDAKQPSNDLIITNSSRVIVSVSGRAAGAALGNDGAGPVQEIAQVVAGAGQRQQPGVVDHRSRRKRPVLERRRTVPPPEDAQR